MFMNPLGLWRHWMDASMLALEAQNVIALRMMRMASGGPLAASEAQRMVIEKLGAVASAQVAAGLTLASGGTVEAAYVGALAPFRKRVRANRRRLGRG